MSAVDATITPMGMTDITASLWADDDDTPIDFSNGGNIWGRVCGCCTFDESVIGFEPVPDASGFHRDGTEIIEVPILEFPRAIWQGKVYCDGCFAVPVEDANGVWDRELSRALRAAFKLRDAIATGEAAEPFPYPELITVRLAPSTS